MSSTLSITLTPEDEFSYVPIKLAHISEEDAQEWVEKRHVFRARSVKMAKS